MAEWAGSFIVGGAHGWMEITWLRQARGFALRGFASRLLGALLGLHGAALSGVEGAAEAGDSNNGEDITRPLNRFDMRYQYKDVANSDRHDDIVTLRTDRPIALAGPWSLATRLDLPFYRTDEVDGDNPQGRGVVGVGDFLAQVLLVDTIDEDLALGAGTQVVLPTASQDSMGNGKYRLVPSIGARRSLRSVSDGTWTTLIARWNVSVAGDEARRDISELQFAPQFNLGLAHGWYLILNPASDIRYNLEPIGKGDSGRWFVPLDLALGVKATARAVLSLEVSVPLIEQYHVYDLKVELRLGYSY